MKTAPTYRLATINVILQSADKNRASYEEKISDFALPAGEQ